MHRALGHVSFRRLALPDNLVYEPFSAEYLIEDGFGVEANVPIEVDVNRSGSMSGTVLVILSFMGHPGRTFPRR